MKTKKQKLPKAFKTKWLKALRSGKYEQYTEGGLYSVSNNSYCCLGVAGHICGVDNSELRRYGYLTEIENNKIPKLIQGDKENPVVDKLTEFNDNGKSFKWIASYIERYL